MRTEPIKAGLRHVLGLRTASRLATLMCITAVGIVSLAPAEAVVRTSVGGQIEHVVAYAGTTFTAATAYGGYGNVRVSFALLAYAGALEFLQRFSPGRTSSFEDYMFSAAGVLAGMAAVVILGKWRSVANEPMFRH